MFTDMDTSPNLSSNLTPFDARSESPAKQAAPRKLRVNLMIADTGSGHRACAEAISAALEKLEPGIDCECIDILGEAGGLGAGFPAMYRWMGRHPRVWGALFRALDGKRRRHLMFEGVFWSRYKQYKRATTRNKPDLVVVLHPAMTTGAVRVCEDIRDDIRLCTVVTDPATGHASWYERGMDLCVVSTDEARQRALSLGVEEEVLKVVGHPVHPRVAGLSAKREALRQKYGWSGPVILCTGGGDGQLGMAAMVDALAEQSRDALIVVACGRNEALRKSLTGRARVEALGFVDDLPERMAAADVVVTKAGPSTLAEARAVGTPVVVYDFMPGQEDGNLPWATQDGGGTVALGTQAAANAARDWLSNELGRTKLRQRAVSTSKEPSAAERIASLLLNALEDKP